MSVIVKDFGGFVLKYVGDAVLAFFVVIPGQESEGKAACTHAISCAKCMLQVAHGGNKSNFESIWLPSNEYKDRNRSRRKCSNIEWLGYSSQSDQCGR